ncbi:hypothetical protein SUDANB120_00289 [Streptomyces sp. enrichment culture]
MTVAGGRDTGWLLPPDLDRLKTLERWCELLLELVRERIGEIETAARIAEAAAGRPVPAPVVEWQIQYGIGASNAPMLIHTGDCTLVSGRTRPATRAQAVDALRHPQVEPCGVCDAGRLLGAGEP